MISWLGKIVKCNNTENIFVINGKCFHGDGLCVTYNNVLYRIKFREYSQFTVVELPESLDLKVDDIVLFTYPDLKYVQENLKLPKCTNNIIFEMANGTCYYNNNIIDIFPYGDTWNIKNIVTDPQLYITPNVLAEQLFATYQDFLPSTVNRYIVDIYDSTSLYKKDVELFTNEQVGINYYLFLNNLIDNIYYGNIRLLCKTDKVEILSNGAVIEQFPIVENPKYKKFNMNQYIMNEFQNDINLSIKVIEVDENDSLTTANFVDYKKYINTYNYTELQQGIFDSSDIYKKIKNNINQGAFKSIDEYESAFDLSGFVYDSTSIGQSDNGQYNYPDIELYLIYTSKVSLPIDSTSALTDSTVLYKDISMIIKLKCNSDSTSYNVLNAFIVPYDFSNEINREIIKISDDKWYYCSNNINILINMTTNETFYQNYIDATNFEYDSSGVVLSNLYGMREAYKYIPMYYKNNQILYETANYTSNYGRDIFGIASVIYEYAKIKELSESGNTFGFKPSAITSHNSISDILFNSIHTEMYLNLNKNVQYNNYNNNKLLNILDSNVILNQNGTTSLLNDDSIAIKLENNLYFNTHTCFNEHTVAILNVIPHYDTTTDKYTYDLNYDIFGDSIYIPSILNIHDLNLLSTSIKENEILYILMERDNTAVIGTEFEIYPKNITITVSYMSINGAMVLFTNFPNKILNMNDKTINKYYRYKQINRFKIDYLDNVLYLIDII